MSLTKYATAGEARNARQLVAQLLALGTVSVQDGEEWTVTNSTDRDAILDALCTTDMDRVLLREPSGKRVGSFLLVWGNAPDGSELIADHSDNDVCNAIAEKIAA